MGFELLLFYYVLPRSEFLNLSMTKTKVIFNLGLKSFVIQSTASIPLLIILVSKLISNMKSVFMIAPDVGEISSIQKRLQG